MIYRAALKTNDNAMAFVTVRGSLTKNIWAATFELAEVDKYVLINTRKINIKLGANSIWQFALVLS